MARQDIASGLRIADRLLALEPWSERAHRQHMMLLAFDGQRDHALRQYALCKSALAEELDVAPSREMVQLYERIKHGDYPVERLPPSGAASKTEARRPTALRTGQTAMGASFPDAPLPEQAVFYGRQREMEQLFEWTQEEEVRFISIYGMGGQGKSALARRFAGELSSRSGSHFDRVLWRSLVNAPSLASLLQDWIIRLSDNDNLELSDDIDQLLNALQSLLSRQRCLLVLDNFESILAADGRAGAYRAGYETYQQLLDDIIRYGHRSILLITSRESPRSPVSAQTGHSSTRFLALAGLADAAGRRLLAARQVAVHTDSATDLVRRCSGNPLALLLAARAIREIFGNDIDAYLAANTMICTGIHQILNAQFERLAPLELDLMIWLAIERVPVSLNRLHSHQLQPLSKRTMVEALGSLRRRSLIEGDNGTFYLQNVVMEFVTDLLNEELCAQLAEHGAPQWPVAPNGHAGGLTLNAGVKSVQVSPLNRFPLVMADAQEDVRRSQRTLLLQPVADCITEHWGKEAGQAHLRQILHHFRQPEGVPSGYAGSNILHLLSDLGADLRGENFSRLGMQQAILDGLDLTETNFSGANLTGVQFSAKIGNVHRVIFSPDQRYLAVASWQGDVLIWCVKEWQFHRRLVGHESAVTSVVFSADSRTLISGGLDGAVRLWDITSGDCLQVDEGCGYPIHAVAISPDGETIASGDAHGICLRSTANIGDSHRAISTEDELVRDLAFSPDGRIMASAGDGLVVRLWDMDAGGKAIGLLRGHDSWVWSVAFHPDGHILASGSMDGTVRLWDWRKLEEIEILDDSIRGVTQVRFSANGRLLVQANADNVRVWDIQARHLIFCGREHDGHVMTTDFSPDSAIVASSGRDSIICIWDAHTGNLVRKLSGQRREALSLNLAGESQTVVAGYRNGTVRLWHTNSGAMGNVLKTGSKSVSQMALSPDGEVLAVAGMDGAITLWRMERRRWGEQLGRLEGHQGMVLSLAFSPDSRSLVSSANDGAIRLWDVNGRRPHGRHGIVSKDVHWRTFVIFGQNNHTLFSYSGDQHVVRLWDLTGPVDPDGRVIARVDSPGFDLDLAPDGKELVVGLDGKAALVGGWSESESSGAMREFEAPDGGWVQCVRYSPDGALVAGSTHDCIYLWRAADGLLLHSLRGRSQPVTRLMFNSDGSRLFSSNANGDIVVTNPQTGEDEQTLRAEEPYAGMNITGVIGVTDEARAALRELGAVTDIAHSLAQPDAGSRGAGSYDPTPLIRQPGHRHLRQVNPVSNRPKIIP